MNKLAQKLVISSTPEGRLSVEKLIEEIAYDHKISQKIFSNILLCTLEAVINAIVHGNQNDPHKHVTIDYSITNKELEFIVEDEGSGFDFSNLADPTLDTNILIPNGRGVYIMRSLTDNVKFTKNGACVALTYKIE